VTGRGIITPVRTWLAGIVVGASVALGACLRSDTYPCDQDPQCQVADQTGRCVNGWCAYPDEMCPSGFAFSVHADPGVAEDCVPAAGATDGFDTEGLSEGQTSFGPDVCADGCDTPPGPCFAAEGSCDAESETCIYAPSIEGTPCDEGNLCAGASVCDGAGACVVAAPVVCDQPPSTCHAATGECDPVDGSCFYTVQPSGAPCEDGDGCTVGDVCDEAGACVPGTLCPSNNPCQAPSCVAGACEMTPVADGTSCGALAADRCCGGNCVDISSDVAHCGGCGFACNGGKACESVAVTNTCSPAPADETGRCTCDANADCPGSQICRTVAPFANRCAPPDAGGCAGVFVDVQLCPNYCTY
jgi:hypothetical protein